MPSHSTSNLQCPCSNSSWWGQGNGTAARKLYSLPNAFPHPLVLGKPQTVAVTGDESRFCSRESQPIEPKFYSIESKFYSQPSESKFYSLPSESSFCSRPIGSSFCSLPDSASWIRILFTANRIKIVLADCFSPPEMGLLKVQSTANCICHAWREDDQLDMLVLLVLHWAHFELLAKFPACPTDSVEEIHQQVSQSCNKLGNSLSRHVGWVGGQLWRSDDLHSAENQMVQGRLLLANCLFVGETLQAC